MIVPASLRRAAREVGIVTSLAVTVLAERWLVTRDCGGASSELVAFLDARAESLSEVRLSGPNAHYARTLFGALNGRLAPTGQDNAALVVPSRLAGRLHAVGGLELRTEALRGGLVWELASVRNARTMTEWALAEAVASYPLSAARQAWAAASAAL